MSLFQHVLDDVSLSQKSNLGDTLKQLFKSKPYSLAVIETVTGGAVSSYLSHLHLPTFIGGTVCHHPRSLALFGASSDMIQSPELHQTDLVKALLKGANSHYAADVSVATVGILSAEVPDQNIVSRITLGFAIKEKVIIKTLELSGTIRLIIENSTLAALTYLKQYLINERSEKTQ